MMYDSVSFLPITSNHFIDSKRLTTEKRIEWFYQLKVFFHGSYEYDRFFNLQ